MTAGAGGSALGAALVARRSARERAEGELAQRLRDVRRAEGELAAAAAVLETARTDAERVWCEGADPAKLQLIRAGAQAAVDSAKHRRDIAGLELRNARDNVVLARETLAVASAEEEAVARLLERRAAEDALVAARRAEEAE